MLNIPANLQLPLMIVDKCQHWLARWPSKVTSCSPKSPTRSSLDRAAPASLACGNSSFMSSPFLTPDSLRGKDSQPVGPLATPR